MKFIHLTKKKKNWEKKILNNALVGKSFYFVHSFIGLTKNLNSTIAVCNYSGISIPAVVSVVLSRIIEPDVELLRSAVLNE